MKALSIKQPWANLIASGSKDIEARDWATKYRGILAIHASKALDKTAEHELKEEYSMWAKPYVFGHIIAIVELVGTIEFLNREMFNKFWGHHKNPTIMGGYEYPKYGWILKKVRCLDTPIPWRGMPGLFEVEL